jgi:hypothetical protein
MQTNVETTKEGFVLTVINLQDAHSGHDEVVLARIPCPAEGFSHYTAEVDWADQGWGNRKGRIGIRGVTPNLFSDFAGHERSTVTATDTLNTTDALEVVYNVGGGGGHTLTVHSLTVKFFARRPAEPSRTAIKLLLQRKNGVEVRRIGGDYTFGQLQTLMGQWWDSANVKWQYKDNDGDVVTLSSHEEWLECLRVHHEHRMGPVRLIVTKTGKMAPVSKAPVIAPVEVCAAELCNQQRDGTNVPVEVPPASLPTAVESARALLVALYGPSVVKGLWAGDAEVAELVGPVARVLGKTPGGTWDPTKRVDVDIDLAAMRNAASVRALELLGAGANDQARQILALALAVPTDEPTNDIVLRYNYACALALCGQPDAALTELAVAIAHGYSNGVHLSADEDLVSLHGREEFHTLVAQILPKESSVKEVVVPTPTPEPVAPAPPAPPVLVEDPVVRAPVDPSIDTLMSIFPGMDEATAAEVLSHAGNNVRRAIEMFLGA